MMSNSGKQIVNAEHSKQTVLNFGCYDLTNFPHLIGFNSIHLMNNSMLQGLGHTYFSDLKRFVCNICLIYSLPILT